jgi:ribosomal protein L11 methyltransferase
VIAGGEAPGPAPTVANRRWLRVEVRPSLHGDASAARDSVMAALFAHGSSSVQEDGDLLIAYVAEGDADDAALRRSLALADPQAQTAFSSVADVDWGRRWREGVRAHNVGALTVTPPWLAGAFDPALTVVIEPGLGFGTGEHETTRGVMRLLPHVLRPGDVVADLGAGSAVLAIAAAKLGAARVAAIEIDETAIGNAEDNVVRNGVEDRIHIIAGDAAVLLPLVAPVRVVLANIISSVLVELLPVIGAALADDGCAVLSGILTRERAAMVDVLAAGGWQVEREDSEGAWWSAVVAPR